MNRTKRKMRKAEVVGNILKNYREENGFSLEEISQLLDIPVEEIIQWEEGKKLPPLDYLEKLDKIFKFGIDRILKAELTEVTITLTIPKSKSVDRETS